MNRGAWQAAVHRVEKSQTWLTDWACMYQTIRIYVPNHMCVCVCVCVHTRAQLLSGIWLFVILWTAACQALLSMGFLRQACWSGLPFPHPGDLPWPRDWTWVSCIAGGLFTSLEVCITVSLTSVKYLMAFEFAVDPQGTLTNSLIIEDLLFNISHLCL